MFILPTQIEARILTVQRVLASINEWGECTAIEVRHEE